MFELNWNAPAGARPGGIDPGARVPADAGSGVIMEGLFVIQLVGVAGLFIGLGFFISLVLKMHRTLTEMEATLRTLGEDIEDLTPRISSALQEIEKTGQDIGITANATTALLNRVGSREGTTPMIDGAARLLPVAVSLLRHVIPALKKKNKS